jgi:putative ABC transport system permease protein
MIPIARRMIWKEKARFLITVVGVGFSVMLMMFLSGVYEGVKKGATSYVSNSPTEIWICQSNSTNLLRSSSFLNSSLQYEIQRVDGIDEVTAVLRVLATTKINDKLVTLFVFGFDPKSNLGIPMTLVQGTSAIGSGEIILDKAFAAKHNLTPGDTLQIQGKNFRLSGICEGTNAIVAQFAFTTLEDAQRLLGLPDIVSFFLLTTDGKKNREVIMDSLRQRFPMLAVFSKEEFIQNNLEEMATGVLPILGTITLFGVIIGTAVITLMLYGSVLERREEYALLKAIGASQKFLVWLVLRQSLLLATVGFAFGLLLDWIAAPVLIKFVPEITLFFTWRAAATVFVLSLSIGTLGAWAPINKLSRIYPAEVFRA